MKHRPLAIMLAVVLLVAAILCLALERIPRAHAQASLMIELLGARLQGGADYLVHAPGEPSYTCYRCTATVFAVREPYRATVHVQPDGAAWELIVEQGGQVRRVGTAYTQRLVIVRK